MYRICKRFEFPAAHVLSKHPGRCRFPHGHTYVVEVTMACDGLDENDMVCDLHALKAVVGAYLDRLDHAVLLNSADEQSCQALGGERAVIFDCRDPSSEVLAHDIFEHVKRLLGAKTVKDDKGVEYRLNARARLEKVRVWETPTAWAEYEES